MMALLDMIPQEEKDKGIVICGDLIDRGNKSRQIVQWCIDNKIQVVRGNHEDMMIDETMETVGLIKRTGVLPMGISASIWTVNGGFETLESYKDYSEDEVDDRGIPVRTFDFDTFLEHVEWLKTLPYYIEFPDIKNDEGRYLTISHSNIGNVWDRRNSKNKSDIEFFTAQIAWGRPHKIKDVPEIYNVIGHTPQDHGPRIRKTYANIDTGCFWTRDAENCRLTALQFPEMIVYEHENIDTYHENFPKNPAFKNILTVKEVHDRKKKHRLKP